MTTRRSLISGRQPDRRSAAELSPSAVDHVILAVKEGIREGTLAPGQRLIELDLARQLQVSRGSVREGLRRLASDGFLEQRPFSGVSVRKMSRREVIELSEIREILEGLAASLAAQRLTRARAQAFAELERKSGGKSATAPEHHSLYNKLFHGFIMEASEQNHLPLFLERTQLEIIRLQFQRVLLSQKAITRSRGEHAAIFEAIVDRDPKRAERAMRLHIQNSTKFILEAPDHLFLS